TWITARARGGETRLVLKAHLPDGDRDFEMKDDGASRDGAAGDGTYGVELPAQPHNTPVTFQLHVFSGSGDRVFPLRTDPQQFHGYYVNDNQPESKLPVYTLLLPSGNARSYLAGLSCSGYQPISFAHQGDLYSGVGIRRRGGSVCGDPDVIKKYLKIRFHKGHEFKLWPNYELEGHKNINLQSLWTDKALIRENIAWALFDEILQSTEASNERLTPIELTKQ
ncbi:MAG: choice-of-anchor X domain-containing protein, partial [Pseudomonadota bacterium]